jgi:hypothetical protein
MGTSYASGVAALNRGTHTEAMPNNPRKREEDYQQIARRVLDTVAPDAEAKKKRKKRKKSSR